MPYVPHTKDDIKSMLETIGKKSVGELLNPIPDRYRLGEKDLSMAEGLSEYQVRQQVEKLAGENITYPISRCFIGAGAYYHFIPSATGHIVSRSEFYTAYTPYQPEVSQGTLQAVFEFQTMMCRIAGMDVSNASMYDGATALAEAVLVAYRFRREKKNKVLIPASIHPDYIDVLKGYLTPFGIEIVFVPVEEATGEINIGLLKEELNDVLAVVVQSPNFFGIVESQDITKLVKETGGISIFLGIESTSLGMFKSPGELGFDLAVLEIQSLGNPPSFGGPHAGVILSKNEFMRYLPGRIIGETKDVDGKRAFVLTLATREQHIRREKATSNICTNEALVALRTAVYLSLIGEEGYKNIARSNYNLAHYTKDLIDKVSGVNIKYTGTFYNEFLVEFKSNQEREKVYTGLKTGGYLPGYRIDDNRLLITVTEVQDKTTIDEYVELFRRYLT